MLIINYHNLHDSSVFWPSTAALRGAASRFDITVTTFRDRYHGKYKEGKHYPGPSPGITTEQESTLSKHMLYMAKIGYGMSNRDVPNLIKEVLNKAENEEPENYLVEKRKFKDNKPSENWVYRFLNTFPAAWPTCGSRRLCS